VRLKIWGCRGSVPTPGAETLRYGGNTSCIEVSAGDGTVIVLDAGSGIRQLGADLLQRGVRRIHLLLTHLHLDHFEGLRFFGPLWDTDVSVDIWGPSSPVFTLHDRIARSFSPPLFPIELQAVPAQVTFHDLPRQRWTIDSATVEAALVLHRGPTVGYRIETDRGTLAYLPDHEPALGGEIGGRTRDWLSGGEIAAGADLLIHDAQYFEEEYEQRVGWGHSSVAQTVEFSRAVDARRLVLFHHEPEHSDQELERLEARAQELASGADHPPVLAREGMVLDVSRLSAGAGTGPTRESRGARRAAAASDRAPSGCGGVGSGRGRRAPA
jgi:phosphoribosyl 1,2-cyclic phosphodiesterase